MSLSCVSLCLKEFMSSFYVRILIILLIIITAQQKINTCIQHVRNAVQRYLFHLNQRSNLYIGIGIHHIGIHHCRHLSQNVCHRSSTPSKRPFDDIYNLPKSSPLLQRLYHRLVSGRMATQKEDSLENRPSSLIRHLATPRQCGYHTPFFTLIGQISPPSDHKHGLANKDMP